MAPSHMEHETNTLEYTHKKFNCGYSHKKLGLRLVRRSSQEEMLQDQEMSNSQICTSTSLFRPYALDAEETTPKKMKTNFAENQQQTPSPTSTTYPVSQRIDKSASHYYTQHYSQQQSPDAYALKLQRQRAALYMKHVMQYYENGNGWPTVHPKAFSNGLA